MKPVAAEISGRQLASMLTYPAEWGPTEWGPIPFLPDNDVLVQKMEKQWGDLRTYRCVVWRVAEPRTLLTTCLDVYWSPSSRGRLCGDRRAWHVVDCLKKAERVLMRPVSSTLAASRNWSGRCGGGGGGEGAAML